MYMKNLNSGSGMSYAEMQERMIKHAGQAERYEEYDFLNVETGEIEKRKVKEVDENQGLFDVFKPKQFFIDAVQSGQMKTLGNNQGIRKSAAEIDNFLVTFDKTDSYTINNFDAQTLADFKKEMMQTVGASYKHEGGRTQTAALFHDNTENFHFHFYRHRVAIDGDTVKPDLDLTQNSERGNFEKAVSQVLEKFGLSTQIQVDAARIDAVQALKQTPSELAQQASEKEIAAKEAGLVEAPVAKTRDRSLNDEIAKYTQIEVEDRIILTAEQVLAAQVAKQEAQLEADKQKLAGLQHAKAAVIQLAETKKALHSKELEAQDLTQELAIRDAALEQERTDKAFYKDAYSQAVEELSDKKAELEQVTQERDQLFDDLTQANLEKERLKEVEKELDELKISAAQDYERLEQTEEQLEIMRTDFESMQQQNAALNAQIAMMQQEHIKAMMMMQESFAERVKKIIEEQQAVERERDQFKKDFLEASERIMSESNERASLEAKNGALEAQLDESVEMITSLTKERDHAVNNEQIIKNAQKSLKAEVESLKLKVKEMDDINTEIATAFEKRQDEIEALKKQLSEQKMTERDASKIDAVESREQTAQAQKKEDVKIDSTEARKAEKAIGKPKSAQKSVEVAQVEQSDEVKTLSAYVKQVVTEHFIHDMQTIAVDVENLSNKSFKERVRARAVGDSDKLPTFTKLMSAMIVEAVISGNATDKEQTSQTVEKLGDGSEKVRALSEELRSDSDRSHEKKKGVER